MTEQLEWPASMLILDRSGELHEPDPLYALALDELLCRGAAEEGQAFCHLWRHPAAFVIGARDKRLPQAAQAVRWIESQGMAAALRHSGGLAVPLDAGIVNMSLIFPHAQTDRLNLHDDFERMYGLVRESLAFTGREVVKGEVSGAYCPGDYDLSIAGRKFCGIAQRRKTRARIVQAFVIAAGEGAGRARLVREFYSRAAGDADPSTYPHITDGSTASLDELAGLGPGAAKQFAEAVVRAATARGAAPLPHSGLPADADVRAMLAVLRERYSLDAE